MGATLEQQIINLEHRLETAKAEITTLQERVSFAEIARDNMAAQKDEIQRRAKLKTEHAGHLIAELLALLKPYCAADEKLAMRVQELVRTHTLPEQT